MSLVTTKKKYRVRLDYADNTRSYIYGLKPDLTNWLISDRERAITMLTPTIAASVAYEVNRAVNCLPLSALYAVASVEPFITRAQR